MDERTTGEMGGSPGAVLALRVGELVRIRSEEEILATLDVRGEIDGLPFMPEMRRFCGLVLRVHRRADKTCDTISGSLGARRMRDAVHLVGVRCSGADHGGCQAACLIFWKEAWLERTEPSTGGALASWTRPLFDGRTRLPAPGTTACTRAVVEQAAVRTPGEEPTYRCQVTQLLDATTPLSPRLPVAYLRDWLGGNASLAWMLKVALMRLLTRVVWGRGFRLKVRIYDAVAGVFGEPAWPFHPGQGVGPAPREVLDLKPGDLVQIKSHAEIRATLRGGRHLGLSFAPEMVRYCGGTYRVRARVERILDESSGRMLHMKHDCIILEDVVCQSECSTGRLFCPRGIYPYWREIWLRKLEPLSADETESAASTRAGSAPPRTGVEQA